MSDRIKLRMTTVDLDIAAHALDKTRGKDSKIPRVVLAKMVCDYGTLFDFLERERIEIEQRESK